MSLSVQQLVKIYGTQKAVNGISFTIQPGEIAGFLGPNGAGKSTTLKIIAGYLQPDAGKAMVCGIDVQEDPIAIKRKIGYLSEANPLYFDMYVREYLQFIAGIHQVQHIKKRMEETIELTGLIPESKKKIGQLSKGYKQRVGLAAALIHDPEVLILDEPTSGLDPNQIVEIRNVIKQQGKNKTVFFSSHILQEVEAICDRIIIIHKGELVADDSLLNLQQKNYQASIKLSFKEAIDEAWLQNLPSVNKLDKLNDYTWRLHTENSADTRKQVLELVLLHQLNIISLENENSNLEEIFRSLTNPSETHSK